MLDWIRTRYGEFALQIMAGPRRPAVNIVFDPKVDCPRSESVLTMTDGLRLRLYRRKDGSTWDEKLRLRTTLCLYFGSRPARTWTRGLALPLVFDDEDPERMRWDVPFDDVKRFVKEWRCPAVASLTLCMDERRPITRLETGADLSTKVRFGSDGWTQALYHRTLEELNQDLGTLAADITSSFELQALARDAQDRAGGSEPLELYYRLKFVLRDYEALLADIVARPGRRLRHRVQHLALHPSAATQFHRENRGRYVIGRTEAAAPVGGRRVPVRFQALEICASTEVASARFIERSAGRVAGWIRDIESAIEDYVQAEHESLDTFLALHGRNATAESYHQTARQKELIEAHRAAAGSLRETRTRLRRRVAGISPSDGSSGEVDLGDSAILSLDPRYSELRRLSLRLLERIRFANYSPEAFPFEVEPWNVLYERWCLVRVVDALRKLGFKDAGTPEMRGALLYNRPIANRVYQTFTHPALPGERLEVWFARRYPIPQAAGYMFGLETRTQNHRTTYPHVSNGIPLARAKRTPDITLEFYPDGEQVPRIVTLDPTLSLDSDVHAEKYEYRESIRSFVAVDPDDRQSLRIVKAAWAICPGEPNPAAYLSPRAPKHRHGMIVLRPDPTSPSVDSLPGSLLKILRSSDAAPALPDLAPGRGPEAPP